MTVYKLQQPHTKQPLFNYSFVTSEEAEVAFIPLPLIEYLCVYIFWCGFFQHHLCQTVCRPIKLANL